jgi:hypothetical protein
MAIHSMYTLTWMLGVPCWLLDIEQHTTIRWQPQLIH